MVNLFAIFSKIILYIRIFSKKNFKDNIQKGPIECTLDFGGKKTIFLPLIFVFHEMLSNM